MRSQVEKRAACRCEYCHAPQGVCAYTFHLEHILPRTKGGVTALSNFALACFPCNNAKAAHVSGIDPETGEETPLFHPRKQRWEEHFEWSRDFTRIRGRTPVGRATVERLRMNARLQVKARPLWAKTESWP
jgi:5-methylcytosine-specific restriction endonuclease McrA